MINWIELAHKHGCPYLEKSGVQIKFTPTDPDAFAGTFWYVHAELTPYRCFLMGSVIRSWAHMKRASMPILNKNRKQIETERDLRSIVHWADEYLRENFTLLEHQS